ncbi:TPA: hypothetical protein ACJ66A_001043 [Streptococcus pyogenes]|uniref:hypothetical protein n=1 Tax=Streptococcus pyogenes TaxID=1314 RepID=UPI000DA39E46|nr:hypothetical protein [Streptococcus pyogenes]SQG41783.1 Uncharacterised protein [Streptococcus pyogenes]VGQ23208.1 Uncharacterised protein [Streptococcus pyogenes]VGQ30315.1 Uncharacterised protein [Streptococcus pyogenes]VGQ72806.1 Uncharacterised protein [Streptococcus pyogenes]VGR00835.1 Uncharacterised protein [Streptococcus pyogenes]
MDVFIARVKFPNDPNQSLVAHQMFVGKYISSSLVEFYSISSIPGKERRVFAGDGTVNEEIALIIGDDQKNNGFKIPSFVDCSKSYTISLNESVNLAKLNHRKIDPLLFQQISSKIDLLKMTGRHTNYSISLMDFISWNQKII